MSTLNAGTVAAILTLDAGQFTTGLSSARVAASVFGRDTSTVTEKMKALGNAAASVGKVLTTTVTVTALAAAVAVTSAAADLEDSANKVSTIADTTILSTDEIKDGLQDLAVETGKSTDVLAEGMYNVISATGDTANALGYLEIATKTAVGGFSDTTTAVDGLTSVLNSYGESGTGAMQSIADMMLTAQNFGKTTVNEIAASIGNVAATASSMGVGIDELMASLATLTKNGLGTSEAVTGLKAAFSNILSPTADAAKAAEALGIDFSAASLSALGLSGFVDMVSEAAGGNTQVMSELFGSVEALNAMLILTGETGMADFDDALSAMATSTGAVDAAYAMMTSGISTQAAQVKQNFVGLMQDYGALVAPVAEAFLGKISDVIDYVRSLDDETQQFVVTAAGVAAAIGPIILMVGKLIALFSGPVGWVALAATAVTGMVALTAAMHDASNGVDEFLDATADRDLVADMTAKLTGEVEIDETGVSESATTAIDKMKEVISTTLDEETVGTIVDLINGNLDPITVALTTFGIPAEQADELEQAVNEARSTLAVKLNDLGLTQDQIDYVCNDLIGADYDTVYETVKGFGLSDKDAKAVADGVTNANGTISDAWDGWDLLSDEDKGTLVRMVNSDRAALYYILSQLGLTDKQIGYIIGVFDETSAKLGDELPNLRDKVLETYTDGEADTDKIVDELAGEVTGIYEDARDQVNQWFEDEKAKLDPTSPTYDADLAALTEKKNTYLTDLETSATGMTTWLSTMANASEAYVLENIEQFDALMAVMQEVIDKTDEANAAVTEQDKNAYEAVSKGTVTDENSVVRAGQYAEGQYEAEIGSTQAKAAAERAKVEEAVAKGWMTTDEGNAAAAQIDQMEEEELAKAKAAYQEMINHIFEGLNEYDPEGAQAVENKLTEESLKRLTGDLGTLTGFGDSGADASDELKNWINEQYAAGNLEFSPEEFENATGTELQTYVAEARAYMLEQLAQVEGTELPEDSTISTTFSAFLEAGFLEPLGIDTSTTTEAYQLMGGDMGAATMEGMTEGVANNAASVKTAIETAGEDAISGGKSVLGVNSPSTVFREIGLNTMRGWANGITSGQALVVSAIRLTARKAVAAAKAELDIQSPSGVFEDIGKYVPQGFALGIDESAFMADDAIKRLASGGVASATKAATGQAETNPGGARKLEVTMNNTTIRSDSDIRKLARRLGQYLESANYV